MLYSQVVALLFSPLKLKSVFKKKKKSDNEKMKGLGNKAGIQKGRWETPKKKKKRFPLVF